MNPRQRAILLLTIAAVAVASAPVIAPAAPSPPAPSGIPTFDDATKAAISLQDRIDNDEENAAAIEQRIDAANIRIFEQQGQLAYAHAALAAARSRYDQRIIRLYKSRVLSPLYVLVDAGSLTDFYRRAHLLSQIAEEDRRALEDARIADAEATYQASMLQAAKSELLALKAEQSTRLADLKTALAQQQAILAKLSAVSRAAVGARVEASRQSRERWQASSIPVGSSIPLAEATVDPYSQTYLVPAYQPRHYRTTGRTSSMVCSWYGNEFNGRRAASGQIFNQDDFTCASKTLPFGTRIALTRGERRIIVVVTDRGPYVDGRDLDLSRAAARALGYSGVATVKAEFVEIVK